MTKYITIAPSGKGKTWSVARKMIGDSYTVIATTTNEDYAKRIAKALAVEAPFDPELSETKILRERFSKLAEEKEKVRLHPEHHKGYAHG